MHDADDPDEPSGWHRLPKDDTWKRCTLRGIVDDGGPMARTRPQDAHPAISTSAVNRSRRIGKSPPNRGYQGNLLHCIAGTNGVPPP